MGCAPSPHAELAVPAPRLRVRRRRPRWLHDDAGGRRLHHAVCAGDCRPCRDGHHGRVAPRRRRRLPRRHRSRRVAVPDRRDRDRRVQRAAGARLRRGGAVDRCDADFDAVPQSWPARRGRRARRRGIGDRRADRPRDPRLGPRRHRGGGRARARTPHVSRPATSTGGWRRAASSTSVTTWSTTSCGPAACLRCSWAALRNGRHSISTRSPGSG